MPRKGPENRGMSAQRNIVLIGFMGTGKTTVGKILADRLNMKFLDMDDIIEEREGKSISRIFAEDGEARFRELERDLARELAAKEGLVIGAGGGVVLDKDNVRDFSGSGVVVCLSALPEIILKRVENESHRPLLKGDKKEKILGILAARRELYNAIPHQIDTSHLTPDEVAEKILAIRD